ncbi:phage prohead protease, HK97 family [Brevundimonas diminuta]|uniref:HK97 family phage prohead protease n=1 Tax=Brevundimonas diminuta TaxID=293 RepID=UPI000D8C1756|nr:HK97 family phage prohead protease [Brevundimonas diminuta]SPU44836.1 phage prohead protease, HK97 family [Brevundimonas diminuta]
MTLLTKNSGLGLDVKAVGDDGVIEGYASTFNVIDSYGEMVAPGAFKASIAGLKRAKRGLKMLWQHDSHQPIGIWDDLEEDAKGLRVVGRLLKDTVAKAAEAYALIREGALDELSIGYRELESAPHPDQRGVTILKKLDLREVSPVTFGALGQAARIDTVKSDHPDLIQKLVAGVRLSEREWERLLKAEPFGLSNSQAERAVRINLKNGQGEPDDTANTGLEFLRALRG